MVATTFFRSILTLFIFGIRQCVEERRHDREGDEVDEDLLPAAVLRKGHVDRGLALVVVVFRTFVLPKNPKPSETAE
jgi:hypothetical protein